MRKRPPGSTRKRLRPRATARSGAGRCRARAGRCGMADPCIRGYGPRRTDGRTDPSVPYSRRMGRIRLGPAHIPDRESPTRAIELLRERGYDAREIDFESGFWMAYPWAERLGELAREHDVALSVHAPLFGWVGHLEASGRKWSSALGALDRSAGIAAASGAEVVVFHPGFLLGRTREDSMEAVVEQLALVRERLVGKGRAG